MKYAGLLFLALPLAAAATTLQDGVSVTETNCDPVFCTVSGGYSGFGTDTFSASAVAFGSNYGGASGGTVTIDVTGKTLGPVESGWIEFEYPACNGLTNVGCNGIVDAGGEASAWFDVGSVAGGLAGEVGQPQPYAGTMVPFEVGQPFSITVTAEFSAPAGGSKGAGAELAFSFQIFDSQRNPLTIYYPPNSNASDAAAPEPDSLLLMAGGLMLAYINLHKRRKAAQHNGRAAFCAAI